MCVRDSGGGGGGGARDGDCRGRAVASGHTASRAAAAALLGILCPTQKHVPAPPSGAAAQGPGGRGEDRGVGREAADPLPKQVAERTTAFVVAAGTTLLQRATAATRRSGCGRGDVVHARLPAPHTSPEGLRPRHCKKKGKSPPKKPSPPLQRLLCLAWSRGSWLGHAIHGRPREEESCVWAWAGCLVPRRFLRSWGWGIWRGGCCGGAFSGLLVANSHDTSRPHSQHQQGRLLAVSSCPQARSPVARGAAACRAPLGAAGISPPGPSTKEGLGWTFCKIYMWGGRRKGSAVAAEARHLGRSVWGGVF